MLLSRLINYSIEFILEIILKSIITLSKAIFFVIGVFSAIFSCQLAMASNLQQTDVDNFIQAMTALNNSEDPDIVGLKNQNLIQPNAGFIPLDKDGNLSIYRQVLKQGIEKSAKEAVEKLVTDNGFGSLDQWALISDKVIAAYLNLKLKQEGGADIPELTDEMRETMPAEMLAMIEKATQMFNSVNKVSTDDLSVVEGSFDQIEALMQ